jgi:hypothetical protein
LAQLVQRLNEIDNNVLMEQLDRRFHKSQLENLVKSVKPDSKSDSFCLLRSGKLVKIMKMERDNFVGSQYQPATTHMARRVFCFTTVFQG